MFNQDIILNIDRRITKLEKKFSNSNLIDKGTSTENAVGANGYFIWGHVKIRQNKIEVDGELELRADNVRIGRLAVHKDDLNRLYNPLGDGVKIEKLIFKDNSILCEDNIHIDSIISKNIKSSSLRLDGENSLIEGNLESVEEDCLLIDLSVLENSTFTVNAAGDIITSGAIYLPNVLIHNNITLSGKLKEKEVKGFNCNVDTKSGLKRASIGVYNNPGIKGAVGYIELSKQKGELFVYIDNNGKIRTTVKLEDIGTDRGQLVGSAISDSKLNQLFDRLDKLEKQVYAEETYQFDKIHRIVNNAKNIKEVKASVSFDGDVAIDGIVKVGNSNHILTILKDELKPNRLLSNIICTVEKNKKFFLGMLEIDKTGKMKVFYGKDRMKCEESMIVYLEGINYNINK